jgi:alpha-1,6-mannosyltransferase
MNKFLINKPSIIALLTFSFLGYLLFGYFIKRQDFLTLVIVYTFLFAIYYLLIQSDFKYKLHVGLLFRLTFIIALPVLSQDYFRFIWDGRMLLNGYNPYLYLPIDLIKLPSFSIPQQSDLYVGMGLLSAKNHSNYPPFNQLIFLITAFLSNNSVLGSVIIMRLFIILADFGLYFYGKKILLSLGKNPESIHWYFLNPLIIIELAGNLHFEGVMMFLFFLGIYFIYRNKNHWAALLFSSSILLKVLPIIVLPLFFRFLSLKKAIVFFLISGFITIAGFLPFYSSQLIANYTTSIGLWFNKFEFNASLYYVFRQIGHFFTGYNMISIFGKMSLIITSLFIAYFSFKKTKIELEKLLLLTLVIFSIYFGLSTTIHPWYLVSLVLLAVFIDIKYPILWSFTVILSYYAYSVEGFKESYSLLLLEYLPVYVWVYFERKKLYSSFN